MWDFSWIERRWPGAGYEDWGGVLDELLERGYDAVRIDAYPHLHAMDPTREWEILPCWNQQVWGSPARNRIVLQPALIEFLSECANRGIMVGLSSWYQDDTTHARLAIPSPEVHGLQWVGVLADIEAAGLLDTILYVDLCNEWPFACWAPFFNYDPKSENHVTFASERSLDWMNRAIRVVKERFDLPTSFSLVGVPRDSMGAIEAVKIDAFDFWEPHLWMVHANRDEFNKRIGYTYTRWDSSGYEAVVERARPLYTSAPGYWQDLLRTQIAEAASFSRAVQRPLVTTECWGIVDYKDWPLLDWDWVKDLCEVGTLTAAATGCWGAIATSNFCGPQFVGMWRDIAWHQRLTTAIRQSPFVANS
jgi:hypothetical protein